MQRVAKLVEEGLHLAQSEQRRLLRGGLGEVHHHRHMRTHVLALLVDILSLILGHPCPTLLAFAWMEVGIEHSQEGAVLIEHFVGFHIRMIDWNVLVLLERDAIQTVGQAKHAIDDFLQLEIRTEHLGIDIIFSQLELMRIV